MEGICGVFQSTLVAPWVTAGTGLIAIGLYLLNRKNQLADMAKRRRVVHAALKQRVELAMSNAAYIANSISQATVSFDNTDALIAMDLIALSMKTPSMDRLESLQSELFKVGDTGDEIVATYIEQCFEVDVRASNLRKAIESATHNRAEPFRQNAEIHYRYAKSQLDKLMELEPAMRRFLSQFERRHGAAGN